MGHTYGKRPRSLIASKITSIRFRLTMWYVLILTIVLAVFSIIVYTTQATRARTDLNEQLRFDSQQFATLFDLKDNQIHLPSVKGDWLLANDIVLVLDTQGEFVQELGNVSSIDAKQIVNQAVEQSALAKPSGDTLSRLEALKRAGQPLDAAKQLIAGLPGVTRTGETFFNYKLSDPALSGGSANSNYLFYSTLMVAGNNKVGTLIVGRPREDETQLQRLLVTLLLAAPATLLLSAAGGYWLASRAMRPVRTITRAAREIGETELHRRLNLNSHDELGELASTFDGMLDRLQSAFTRQRQFTADASHELRTPLTIVSLEANHALASPRAPQEYERALSIIQSEAAGMAHLVNDLLILARADAGQTHLAWEEVDLSDIALEMVERFDALARQKGVELCTGTLPELRVRGDRVYLSHMLTNLVGNAIKYAGGDDRWVRVETGSKLIGGEMRGWVRVEDNGPGIAAEHLPHIFDRFYRVDKVRTKADSRLLEIENENGGSGLGLSIAQWVAQAHGGEIKVTSEVGQGSVFEVWLPLLNASVEMPQIKEYREVLAV